MMGLLIMVVAITIVVIWRAYVQVQKTTRANYVFPLQRLQPELRDRVYHFAGPNTIRILFYWNQWGISNYTDPDHAATAKALSYTSRALNNEVHDHLRRAASPVVVAVIGCPLVARQWANTWVQRHRLPAQRATRLEVILDIKLATTVQSLRARSSDIGHNVSVTIKLEKDPQTGFWRDTKKFSVTKHTGCGGLLYTLYMLRCFFLFVWSWVIGPRELAFAMLESPNNTSLDRVWKDTCEEIADEMEAALNRGSFGLDTNAVMRVQHVLWLFGEVKAQYGTWEVSRGYPEAMN